MTSSAPLTPMMKKLILSLPGNSHCAECLTPHPTWASLSHAITLCLDCAGIHRGFGVHISFVRSLTMDDWTETQYDRMMRGGNERWNQYWRERCATVEFRVKLAWKKVGEGEMERGEMGPLLRAKYESDEARNYRDLISDSDLTKISDSEEKSSHSGPAILSEEPAPSIRQVYRNETFPFALMLLTSNKKSLTSAVLWTIGGLGLASWVNHRGVPYSHLVIPGIIIVTAAVPYYMVSKMAWRFAVGIVNHRQEAFKSARNLLAEKIGSTRAERLATCDVYYPQTAGEKRARVGFLFYPGALVDRTAYAPIASKLADAGIFVVVANMEPYRVVTRLTPNYNHREKVMRMITDSLLLGGDSWQVDEWSVGGHSMGAQLAVAACSNELSSTVKKVVLWGVGSYPDPNMYPCKDLRDIEGVNVLLMNGSNDVLVKNPFSGKSATVLMQSKLPPRCDGDNGGRGCTYYVTVEGGNHSGCAHYGPQTYPMRDGDRTITLEEQQDQMAKATANFLFGDYSKL